MKIFEIFEIEKNQNFSKFFIQNCMKNENFEIEKIEIFLELLDSPIFDFVNRSFWSFFWKLLFLREGHAEHNSSIEILIVSIW